LFSASLLLSLWIYQHSFFSSLPPIHPNPLQTGFCTPMKLL
jgi:hypothetical protein